MEKISITKALKIRFRFRILTVLACLVLVGILGVMIFKNGKKIEAAYAPTWSFTFGSNGTGNGQFQLPSDIAVDQAGNIYVADYANWRIQKFDSNGNFLLAMGVHGTGVGQFDSGPYAIAIDSSGNIYGVDGGSGSRSKVLVFDSNGTYLRQVGTSGMGNGQLYMANSIAFNASGDMLVSDWGSGNVEVYNSSGVYLKTMFSNGTGDGQLAGPKGIAFDSLGRIYIADSFNQRIQIFSSDGTFIKKFGTPGTGAGQFSVPSDVSIDPSGKLYVADDQNSRVQIFNLEGGYIGEFGGLGTSNGMFNRVYGLTTTSDGKIYTTDFQNNRVQIFNGDLCYLGGNDSIPASCEGKDVTIDGATINADKVNVWQDSAVANRTECDSMENNLITYYKMEDYGHVNNAAATKDNRLLTTGGMIDDTNGRFGKAVSFLGNSNNHLSEKISLTALRNLDSSSMSYTVSVWLKSTGLTHTANIISRSPDVFQDPLRLRCDATTCTFMLHGNNGIIGQLTENVNWDGNWHHLVFSVNRLEGKIYGYFDSVKSSASYETFASTNIQSSTKIGGNPYETTNSFKGSIDEIKVYNRALSDTEVGRLYSKGSIGCDSKRIFNSLTIKNGGVLTHQAITAADMSQDMNGNGSLADEDSIPAQRKKVDLQITTNLDIQDGSSISADGKGYLGGGPYASSACPAPTYFSSGFILFVNDADCSIAKNGTGPGAGSLGCDTGNDDSRGGGAGHGGIGGNDTAGFGNSYNTDNVLEFGSGGGGAYNASGHSRAPASGCATGGAGGGRIRITVYGNITFGANALSAISANGADTNIFDIERYARAYGGGGSGGTVIIRMNIPLMVANSSFSQGASGIGGDPGVMKFFGFLLKSDVSTTGVVSVNGGTGGAGGGNGAGGRLILSKIDIRTPTIKKTLTPIERAGKTNGTFNPYALQRQDKVRVTLEVSGVTEPVRINDYFYRYATSVCQPTGTYTPDPENFTNPATEPMIWYVDTSTKTISYECEVK